MNCPNCGAPIEGDKCGYCVGKVYADFVEGQYTGTLKVDGKEYQVYLGDCVSYPVLEGKNIRMRHKFTLIEI